MSKKPQPGLHEQAMKLFGEMQPDKKEQSALRKVGSYNDRRKDYVANKLKPVLEKMQAAFDRGEVIGGAPSLKVWCRMYKYNWNGSSPTRNALSYARCRQILTGKSGNEGKSKVKSLDPFLQRIADAKKKLADIQVKLNDFSKGAVDARPLYAAIDPAINPLFEEFLKLVAPDGYEVMKAPRGWIVQEKWTAEQIAEAKEKEKPATKIVGTKLSTKRGGGDAKGWMTTEPRKKPTVDVIIEPDCKDGAVARSAFQKAARVLQFPAHTGQHENCKECLRRHTPTDAERAQSELFNATGNLDGEDDDEEQL